MFLLTALFSPGHHQTLQTFVAAGFSEQVDPEVVTLRDIKPSLPTVSRIWLA